MFLPTPAGGFACDVVHGKTEGSGRRAIFCRPRTWLRADQLAPWQTPPATAASVERQVGSVLLTVAGWLVEVEEMSEAKSMLSGFCAEIDGEIAARSFHCDRNDTVAWLMNYLKRDIGRFEHGLDVRIVSIGATIEAVG